MIKYMLNLISNEINIIETDENKTYEIAYISEKGIPKISTYEIYFNTLDEAKQYGIDFHQDKIDDLQYIIVQHLKDLTKIKSIKND